MPKLYDEHNDYIVAEDIREFARALNDPYETDYSHAPSGLDSDSESISPKTSGSHNYNGDWAGNGARERRRSHRSSHDHGYPVHPRIQSKSDWFPVNKRSRKPTNEFRELALYTVLRWPLLAVIVVWIALLGVFYAIVRVWVALSEYFFTWRGVRKDLRERLRRLETYDEWVRHATALDQHLGLDRWSEYPEFSYYDYRLVHKTVRQLLLLRQKGDVRALMVVLAGCLKKNFAGIENRQLYSHRYYGTKRLVEEYVAEVTLCVDLVAAADVGAKEKRRFFRVVLKNYGRTALCLSGGGCFAYTHFGIVKALLDAQLLPSIVLGTLGGGLIAALTCTRSDDELRRLLVPALCRKITACEEKWFQWIPRWWRTGARFDAVAWAAKLCFFTKGSTTFREAYKMTGRRLNVSTVPAEPHSPAILCNSITSPDCVIWLLLLASAAVPGILNPVVLMLKNQDGRLEPYSMGKWRDGSLRTDIPIDALNTYYNVNFSIVSQVNPHISLFFFAPKGTVGRPVATSRRRTKSHRAVLRGGFVATALEQLFRLEIKKWLQITKTLDLLPMISENDWLSVWLQRFTGSITIWPRIHLKDFWYILADPTEAQMHDYLIKGQRSMFPRLLFVKHRLAIERAIERGRSESRGLDDETDTDELADYESYESDTDSEIEGSLGSRRHTVF